MTSHDGQPGRQAGVAGVEPVGVDEQDAGAQRHHRDVEVIVGDAVQDVHGEALAQVALQPARSETMVLGRDVHEDVRPEAQALGGVEHDLELRPGRPAGRSRPRRRASPDRTSVEHARARGHGPPGAALEVVHEEGLEQVVLEVAVPAEGRGLDDLVADDQALVADVVGEVRQRAPVGGRHRRDRLEAPRPPDRDPEPFEQRDEALHVLAALLDDPRGVGPDRGELQAGHRDAGRRARCRRRTAGTRGRLRPRSPGRARCRPRRR